MIDEHRRKIKLFIMAHSGDKQYDENAIDYFAKVVSCYIRCVADRLSLLATHAKRITVDKRDLEIFYLVTSADCQDKRLYNITDTRVEFSTNVIKHYTHGIIKRYSKTMHRLFSMIIAEFVTQIIIRTETQQVSVSDIKNVLKRYHLYNFLSKQVCSNSRVDVK
jgi:hypothetical protein